MGFWGTVLFVTIWRDKLFCYIYSHQKCTPKAKLWFKATLLLCHYFNQAISFQLKSNLPVWLIGRRTLDFNFSMQQSLNPFIDKFWLAFLGEILLICSFFKCYRLLTCKVNLNVLYMWKFQTCLPRRILSAH